MKSEWWPVEFLLPNSEKTKSFDLYDEDPAAYLALARTPYTREGVLALANRFGPLASNQCQDLSYWFGAILRMRRSITLWTKAEQTGDFTAFLKRGGLGSARGFTSNGVKPFLEKNEATGRARLGLAPQGLLDALWMQLALAIDGSQSLRKCAECKKWFSIRSGRGRSDKKYCSNACRMRTYRRGKGKK